MIGRSRAFTDLTVLLAKATQYDTTVLIEGETGTGKELAARAIHYDGPRRSRPFLPVNCGALPDTLIENELFGHCRGAFTGADSHQGGLVAAANGGTLFLDEVDSLSLKGQVTLLRFLEDRQYRPVGSAEYRTADVRVIAASNKTLADLVAADRFRADLFYRLRVVLVPIPPLRDRGDDVLLLAAHVIEAASARFRKPAAALSEQGRDVCRRYSWPGNIRELENVVCQAFLMSEGDAIDLPPLAAPRAADAALYLSNYVSAKQQAIAEFERRFLGRAIEQAGGNITEAARLIGTERRHLGRLLKKYDLSASTTLRPARRPAAS